MIENQQHFQEVDIITDQVGVFKPLCQPFAINKSTSIKADEVVISKDTSANPVFRVAYPTDLVIEKEEFCHEEDPPNLMPRKNTKLN